MDFEALVKMANDPQKKAEAFAGLSQRQLRRDAEFEEEARKRMPGEHFEDRSYDI